MILRLLGYYYNIIIIVHIIIIIIFTVTIQPIASGITSIAFISAIEKAIAVETVEFAWIEGNSLKALMPALVLDLDVFEPLWKQEGAKVEDAVITIELSKLPNKENIIRVGHGWARKNEAKYYLVDREKREIKQLRNTPRKVLYFNFWVDCIHDGKNSACFKWENGKLVKMSNEY